MLTTKRKVIFLVEGTVEGEQACVIGRCGDFALQPGDTFSTVCRYRRRQSLEDFNDPPKLVEQFPVSLRVVSIQAYGRGLEELGPGMTASLVLSGDGTKKLEPGSILEGVGAE